MSQITDIYISSSCTGSLVHQGHGGYGAIIHKEGRDDLLITGNARDTNLEKISFTAAITALTCAPYSDEIRLHTNYKFLVWKFEQQGVKNTPEEDWMKMEPHQSKFQEDGYKPFWHLLMLAGRNKNVTYLHTSGRDESKLERECREMAEQAAKDAQEHRVFHFRGLNRKPQ